MAIHEEYIELISAAVDGALNEQDAARLREHLAQCEDCMALYRDLQELHATLRGLPGLEAPRDLADRVIAAVEEEKVIPFPAGRSNPWKKWVASAAVICLIIAGGSFMGLGARSRSAKSAAPMMDMAGGSVQSMAADAPACEEAECAAPETVADNTDGDACSYSITGGALPTARPETYSVNGSQAPKAAPLPEPAQSADASPAEKPAPANSAPIFVDSFRGDDGAPEAAKEAMDKTIPMAVSAEAPEALAEPAAVHSGAAAPQAALDRLLDRLDLPGYELMVQDIGASWPREGCAQDYLIYDGLSQNGRYYLFLSYRNVYPSEDAETFDHSSTNGLYAVPLDGGDILEDSAPDFWQKLSE